MPVADLTGFKAKASAVAESVRESTGVDIRACYQCGECTGGCPMAFDMDHTPRMIMRLLQLGDADKALASRTIWICAACSTCSARCPRGIDTAAVMDYLRNRALQERKGSKDTGARNIRTFHKIFLESVRYTGRLYEVGLMGLFNVGSGKLMKDVEKAPGMFLKGKLGIIPHMDRNRKAAAVFKRVAEMEGRDNG